MSWAEVLLQEAEHKNKPCMLVKSDSVSRTEQWGQWASSRVSCIKDEHPAAGQVLTTAASPASLVSHSHTPLLGPNWKQTDEETEISSTAVQL